MRAYVLVVQAGRIFLHRRETEAGGRAVGISGIELKGAPAVLDRGDRQVHGGRRHLS
jgi:hypothetical protein